MSGWKPIETAPKDGVVLLFFAKRQWRRTDGAVADLGPVRDIVERTEVGFCEDGDIFEAGTGHSVFEEWRGAENTPTHWMSHPGAPGRSAPMGSDDLQTLLKASADKVRTMSPDERRAMHDAQRASFIRAEAGFGSDADETEHRAALASGDPQRIEAAQRAEAARKQRTKSRA